MSEFSNRFRQLKEEFDLTLKDLSDALNITPPNLSYYMKGREPSYDVLINIADYFNVTTDWLIGRTDARNTAQESLYDIIEKDLCLTDVKKLSEKNRSYYLECQNTLYETMLALYNLFMFYGFDETLSKYLSGQFKMYAGTLLNCIINFNKLYVHPSKENVISIIKYGETCSDVQKQLLLATFYNFAKYVSVHDEDIPDSDKESLKEILNFIFESFNEKFPESKTIDLFNQLNNFSLNENVTSKSKFVDTE